MTYATIKQLNQERAYDLQNNKPEHQKRACHLRDNQTIKPRTHLSRAPQSNHKTKNALVTYVTIKQ